MRGFSPILRSAPACHCACFFNETATISEGDVTFLPRRRLGLRRCHCEDRVLALLEIPDPALIAIRVVANVALAVFRTPNSNTPAATSVAHAVALAGVVAEGAVDPTSDWLKLDSLPFIGEVFVAFAFWMNVYAMAVIVKIEMPPAI